MSQIGLVTAEHDLTSELIESHHFRLLLSCAHHNIGISMIPQLLQPPRDVLISLLLGDVIDEQRTHRASVVGRGDSTVTFLARGIPNLRLDRLVIDLDATRGKLDADGGLAVQVELVAGESREQVGFSNAGVSYEHHLEEEVVFVVISHAGGFVGKGSC